MLYPQPTSIHQSRAKWHRRLLELTVAFATVSSPTIALAHGHAACLLAPVGPATPAGAMPGPLRIEIEPTIDDASLLSGWILERNLDAAEEIAHVEGHDQWIVVEVGGSTYDYRVSVMPMRDGVPLEPEKLPEVCECNTEALLALLDERIAAAVGRLRAPPPKRLSEPKPIPEPPSGGSTPTDSPKRLGPMGSVGIGVIVLGAGLSSVGIPLALRPDDIRGEPGIIETRATRGPGIGMAVGGAVALVAGVSLLAVDLARHRKRNVAMIPGMGPGHVGVMVAWRPRGRTRR